jgi:hypothetical protein
MSNAGRRQHQAANVFLERKKHASVSFLTIQQAFCVDLTPDGFILSTAVTK